MAINTSDEFAEKACYLNDEQLNDLYNSYKIKLPKIINSADDFEKVFRFLTSEQRKDLFELIKENINIFTITLDDLAMILRNLQTDQYIEVCDLIEKKMVHIINNSNKVLHLFKLLRPSQKDSLFLCIKPILASLIQLPDDLSKICCSLSNAQCSELYHLTKCKILKTANSLRDFACILPYLNIEQFIEFCKIKQTSIMIAINNAQCFHQVVEHMDLVNRIELYNLIKLNINKLVSNSDDFVLVINSFVLGEEHPSSGYRIPDEDFWLHLYDDIKSSLSTIIKTSIDFKTIMHSLYNLNIIIYRNVYNLIKIKILTLIRTIDDVANILNYLKTDDFIEICQLVKINLPHIINSYEKVEELTNKVHYIPNKKILKSIFNVKNS